MGRLHGCLLVLVAAWMVVAWTPTTAHADGETSAPFPIEAVEDPHRLRWSFPEVHAAEYAVTFVLPIAFRIVNHNVEEPSEPRWRGGVLFDDAAQSFLGHRDPESRETLGRLSDGLWWAVRAYPLLDTLLVSWADGWNHRVAWQTTMINLQAFAVQFFVKLVLMRSASRNRPRTERCLDRGGTADECDLDNVRGFPSGHATSAFTGAGLTCAHHTALPLYGGGLADAAACAGALGVAAGVAVLRVAVDAHYLTDSLVGAVIGLSAGWLMPWLLHYGRTVGGREASGRAGEADDQGADGGPALVGGPMAVHDGLGFAVGGWW